jgi:hypothetical protein
MSNQRSSSFAPLLVAALYIAVFVVIERIGPPGKATGTIAHLGLAFFWSLIATIVIWIFLERARLVPVSMRLGLWGREEWSPSKIYGTLLTLIALSAGPALVLFFRRSPAFILPFTVAATLAILLLFYLLYKLGIIAHVLGGVFLILGILYIGLSVRYIMRLNLGKAVMFGIPMILVSFLALYAGIIVLRG